MRAFPERNRGGKGWVCRYDIKDCLGEKHREQHEVLDIGGENENENEY
jgi:hypothetical protein